MSSPLPGQQCGTADKFPVRCLDMKVPIGNPIVSKSRDNFHFLKEMKVKSGKPKWTHVGKTKSLKGSIQQKFYCSWKCTTIELKIQQKVLVTDLKSSWNTDPKSSKYRNVRLQNHCVRYSFRCQDSTKVGRTIWNELSLGQSCERMKDGRQWQAS